MEESRFFIEEVNPQPKPEIKEEPDFIVSSGDPIQLAPHNRIPVKPIIERTYRLNITYPHTQHQVDYEIKVQGMVFSQDAAEFRFTKDQYFVDGYAPTKVLDELDIAISKILYPMNLNINYKTQKVTLTNLNEIQKRWLSKKEELRQDYQGEFFEKYLKQIDKIIKDSYNFTQKLVKKDLFFSLFTHAIYKEYNRALKIPAHWTFLPSGEKYRQVFTGEQRVEPVYNHLNGIFIYMQAITADKKYQIKAEYNLDAEDYTLKDIVAQLYKKEQENKEILIRCKIHQLREKEPVKYKPTAKDLEEEQRKKEEEEKNYQKYLQSKKSWFDRLFGF
ncbi:hypothetical protein ETU08_03980 [Apibacter muscae]|uniref:hypothetical protein n=1 Tax=Apibacter muscae TaxID=2509004 RepID=UPI0011AC18C2|nr:hypothetical protein [Apibacter muscae]TWP30758.1 hypothetical protein ETU08_03980 [Apibacter muscae]